MPSMINCLYGIDHFRGFLEGQLVRKFLQSFHFAWGQAQQGRSRHDPVFYRIGNGYVSSRYLRPIYTTLSRPILRKLIYVKGMVWPDRSGLKVIPLVRPFLLLLYTYNLANADVLPVRTTRIVKIRNYSDVICGVRWKFNSAGNAALWRISLSHLFPPANRNIGFHSRRPSDRFGYQTPQNFELLLKIKYQNGEKNLRSNLGLSNGTTLATDLNLPGRFSAYLRIIPFRSSNASCSCIVEQREALTLSQIFYEVGFSWIFLYFFTVYHTERSSESATGVASQRKPCRVLTSPKRWVCVV